MPALVLPIEETASPQVVKGGTTNITITIDMGAVQSSNVNLKVNAIDNPTAVSPPGGGSWPYSTQVASGSSKVIFTVTTHTVTSNVPVRFPVAFSTDDITDCTNWVALTQVVVTT